MLGIHLDRSKKNSGLKHYEFIKMTTWEFPFNRWRETNIVTWRRILAESLADGNKRREEYARKMLVEVLGVSEFDTSKT